MYPVPAISAQYDGNPQYTVGNPPTYRKEIHMSETYLEISERLDGAGLTYSEYLAEAAATMQRKANEGDDDASRLVTSLALSENKESYGLGATEYIGARARGDNHDTAMKVAKLKAGVTSRPKSSKAREIWNALWTPRNRKH